MKEKTLFFDLDHTLWDFERNSAEALEETLIALNLIGRNGITAQNFISRYHVINDKMWDEYRRGVIEKEALRTRRFEDALALFSIRENGLAERFAQTYLDLCPRKKNLFPHTEEVLKKLSEKCTMHLITNGFSEVQTIKMENKGLKPYFHQMITSEEAGAKKPSAEIFDYAVNKTGAEKKNSVMIGDDIENDVMAAINAGFDSAVWFNPTQKKTDFCDSRITEIHELTELLNIF
ncbi:MAG: YjjG family noncanonical pyrimidine nucleotidase [Flavobacteriales bacterium]|nr:YjjG family noncanonical pyrimidine nucleotidase [Flavobacteriales bacterium]